jgi:hypothetical protein
MRFVLGAPNEATQRTHRWNNHHLKEEQVAHLLADWMVSHGGDPAARELPKVTILAGAVSHATRFGGWQKYLALAPENQDSEEWYIGWRWKGGAGVSRIPNLGGVRVLVGPGATQWFAIRASDQTQVPLAKIGEGVIGDGGMHSHLPLY